MADFWKTYKPRPDGEQPPLHLAVQAQDLAALQSILDAEAGKAPYEEHRKGNTFISEKDDKGLSALHHAVQYGNLDIIKALIEIGHPVNTKINNKASGLPKGTSAIILATYPMQDGKATDGNRLEVVNLLLAAGATPDKDAVDQLLKLVVRPPNSECCEVMKALIQAGASVDKDMVRRHMNAYEADLNPDSTAGCPDGDPQLHEIAIALQDHLANINEADKRKKQEEAQARTTRQAAARARTSSDLSTAEDDSSAPAQEEPKGKGKDGKGKRESKDKGEKGEKGPSQMQLDKAELRSLLQKENAQPEFDKIKALVEGGVWVTGDMVRQAWYKYQFSCNELESGERDLETGDAGLKEIFEFLDKWQTPGKGKEDSKGKGKYRGDRDGNGKGKYDRKGEDRGGYKGDGDGKGKGKGKHDRGDFKGNDDSKGKGKYDRGDFRGNDDSKGKGKYDRGDFKGNDDSKGKGKYDRGDFKGNDDSKGKGKYRDGEGKGKYDRGGYKGDSDGKGKGKDQVVG